MSIYLEVSITIDLEVYVFTPIAGDGTPAGNGRTADSKLCGEDLPHECNCHWRNCPSDATCRLDTDEKGDGVNHVRYFCDKHTILYEAGADPDEELTASVAPPPL